MCPMKHPRLLVGLDVGIVEALGLGTHLHLALFSHEGLPQANGLDALCAMLRALCTPNPAAETQTTKVITTN